MAATPILAIYLLLTLHSISSASVKSRANSRPVIEVINEQARSDTRTTKIPGNMPYGNPLAGQNARLHAQNQQAMFNAERVRQHRAQVQRWTKAPIQMDSYMKAYHESQENHQMALEKQQAKDVTSAPPRRRPTTTLKLEPVTTAPLPKKRLRNDPSRAAKGQQTMKITKDDAVKDKNRSHRSYGSDYQQYLSNKRYQSVYVSPAPAYDQGVTIKPHGNIGISNLQTHVSPEQNQPEFAKLHTETIPSKTQYVYPKQYSQMQDYRSAQDYGALNSLLKQTPEDQLSHLTTLLQSEDENEATKDINTPIDLYFYMKDQPAQTLEQHYDEAKYAQIPANYAPQKDFTPITEAVDDVADPNQNNRFKTYTIPKPEPPQQQNLENNLFKPELHLETTTIKSNNYYKVEVASQTITSGYKHDNDAYKHEYTSQAKYPVYHKQVKEPEYISSSIQNEEKVPAYEALHYPHPTVYGRDPKHHEPEEDLSELYLHHNAQHNGIQHLTEDGAVSAYGDDNLHYAANYEFGYRVRDQHSGNDFGHHEEKKGEKTNGAYHVLLPDGRMQKVQYSAGPEGFHADISYDHLQYEHN